MYSWEGSRTSLQAGYSRQISDGGGLAEAVNIAAGRCRGQATVGRTLDSKSWREPTRETIPCIPFLRLHRFGPSREVPESNIVSPTTWE